MKEAAAHCKKIEHIDVCEGTKDKCICCASCEFLKTCNHSCDRTYDDCANRKWVEEGKIL